VTSWRNTPVCAFEVSLLLEIVNYFGGASLFDENF